MSRMLERLFRSRKFLTMVLDLVVSLVIYFVTKYLAPAVAEDVLFVVAGMQPVVLAVIVMWGVEDAAEKRAGPALELTDDDLRILADEVMARSVELAEGK